MPKLTTEAIAVLLEILHSQVVVFSSTVQEMVMLCNRRFSHCAHGKAFFIINTIYMPQLSLTTEAIVLLLQIFPVKVHSFSRNREGVVLVDVMDKECFLDQ